MHDLIEIFKELVQIPSPSLKEERVSAKIIEILTNDIVPISEWDWNRGDVFYNFFSYILLITGVSFIIQNIRL